MQIETKDEKIEACPQFDESERQRCEVWTRVMGYHRPVSSFNKGKKGEHNERLHFIEAKCQARCN